MDAVPNVDIDGSGKFKYILIKATDKNNGNESKNIVRGFSRCEYHDDILKEVKSGLESKCKLDVLGGGKMVHQPEKKRIAVFGESQGFGAADHAKSIAILKEHYPNYTFSDSEDK